MKPAEMLMRVISSKVLALLFRLYLGGIFVYASMYKISFPGEFAQSVASYQIVPHWGVNLMAVIMPWLELICGILLIAGIRSKAAAAIIGGMLTIFALAIFTALVRDIPVGCGCFQAVADPISWKTFARDMVWFAMTVQVYRFDSMLQLDRNMLLPIKDM
jgi:putative oxidoreductase